MNAALHIIHALIVYEYCSSLLASSFSDDSLLHRAHYDKNLDPDLISTHCPPLTSTQLQKEKK